MISPEEAELIAARLLAGLRTATGGSQIAHARRVAEGVCTSSPSGIDLEDGRVVVAALLHDVVENAQVSLDELRLLTNDERVVELVQLLTQRVGESERSYLTRCASDPTALAIKRIDLFDKFVVDDTPVPTDVAARVQRRALRRLALLDQIVAERRHTPVGGKPVAYETSPEEARAR